MAIIARKPFLTAAIICICFFYICTPHLPQKGAPALIFSEKELSFVQGKIVSSPVKTGSGKFYSCTLALEAAAREDGARCNARGNLGLFIPAELVEALFPGRLYSVAAETGGSQLYETGLYAVFSGSCRDGIFYARKCEGACYKNSLWGYISHIRALCRMEFKRLLSAWGKAGGLLLALLCGAREFTEGDTAEAFRNAGISHILALSGMHLSLFSGIAAFAGKKTGSIRLGTVLRIITVCLFVWFAGLSPSLLRAFLCVMLSIAASTLGIPYVSVFDILCVAFLIQCAVYPSHIHNAGFLLSYGALAGISLFSSVIHCITVRFLPSPISSSAAASLSAQTLTAPLSLKLFGTFCPIGIIATTILSPLVTLFIYSGLVLIILSLIFPIFQIPSGIFMNFLYTVIKGLVILFSRAPYIKL